MDSASSNEMVDQSVWMEAKDRAMVGNLTPNETTLEEEYSESELEFDKMAAQVKHLYQPIDFLQSAVTNSLLLFKVSLGLSKTSLVEDCFLRLKVAAGSHSDGMEIVKTSDGPRKLSVSPDVWRTLSDDTQSAISHFNSMLSSAHKYLGSRELKLTDIKLKLSDMKLLPKSQAKERELKGLKGIIKSINSFSLEIDSLFAEINTASVVFEHIVALNGTNN